MAGSGKQVDQMNTMIKENRLENMINYVGHIHPNDLPFFIINLMFLFYHLL